MGLAKLDTELEMRTNYGWNFVYRLYSASQHVEWQSNDSRKNTFWNNSNDKSDKVLYHYQLAKRFAHRRQIRLQTMAKKIADQLLKPFRARAGKSALRRPTPRRLL